jgi:polyhydroxyalkanoate synthesis regulator phasin
MNELLKKAFSLGLGVTIASKEKIQQVVDDLVVKGELEQSESKDLLASLLVKGEEQRDHIRQMVQDQVKKVLDELQIATKQDLKELEARLSLKMSGTAAPAAGAQPDSAELQPPIKLTQYP